MNALTFIDREHLDLTDVPKGTQVLMLTKAKKYILGSVKIDKRNNNRKYVSNDYYAIQYCFLD